MNDDLHDKNWAVAWGCWMRVARITGCWEEKPGRPAADRMVNPSRVSTQLITEDPSTDIWSSNVLFLRCQGREMGQSV